MLNPIQLGLRVKLTAAFVFVSVLTTASLGYFTILHSYKALKSQKQQDELVIAKNIVAQIDEVLGKAKETITTLAHHPSITSSDLAKQLDALNIVSQVTELVDGIVLLDLNGKVLAMDQTEPKTEDLIPENTYPQLVLPIRKTNTTQFSNIFRSKTGDVMVAINAPVYSGGALKHVLSGLILLKNHTMGGIEKIRIGKSGYAYIVDSQGNIIVHPQRERLLENLSNNPAVSELLKNRKEGIIEFMNNEGVFVLAAFASIEETGWGVIVRQPLEESYAYARQVLSFMILAFIGSLIVTLIFGIFLARKITNPVIQLVNGVKQVAKGLLETNIPIQSKDEIGQLAAAFNEMAKKLKVHLQEIENAHKEVLNTQKQLMQSEKMAAIGQLAAGLAHEIYNPLNVISGFTEILLKQNAENPADKKHLEEIYRETNRCQNLIAELLRFAKPKESGKELADIGIIIQEAVSLIQSHTKTQGIIVESKLETVLPVLLIDRDQIKQVVLNLLLNACQAMPTGGELRLSASHAGNRVRIEITDTGIGIPEKNLKNIFNPFFTTKAEGTGLGLALSFTVIESHGGTIEAKSEEGKGSIFTISLPLPKEKNERTT